MRRRERSGGLRPVDPAAALADLPGAAVGEAVLRLSRVWTSAVGPGIATHAWPAAVRRDGTVVVHCSSSTWASELELMRHDVAARLQAALAEPAPRPLRFRLGPVPERVTAAAAPRRPPPEPDARDRATAARLAASVGDERLRERLERLVAGRLAKAGRPSPEAPP